MAASNERDRSGSPAWANAVTKSDRRRASGSREVDRRSNRRFSMRLGSGGSGERTID